MPRKFKKNAPRDPFAALPESFKDSCAAAQTADLQERLAQVAKAEEQNLSAMKADQDLKDKVEAANLARQPYKETTKLNRLKTQYVIRILADRGDSVCQEILKLGAAKV